MANVKISAKPASSATYDGTEVLAGVQTGADAKFAAAQIPAAATHAATAKTLPVDADELPLVDSAATFALKKLTYANLKALFGIGNSPSVPSDFKDSVLVATTANITLSGEQTIDGVLTSASRVLVKDQTNGAQNGIYVSAAGAWSRSTDADTSAEVTSGMMMMVESGTVSADLLYSLITANPITLATTALVFQSIAPPLGFSIVKLVSGTTYTHILTDAGKRLVATNAAAKTITIAPQSSVNSAVNAQIEVFNAGAGLLTLAAGAGVTLNGLLTAVPNQMLVVKKRANPNTWDVTASSVDSVFVNAQTGTTYTILSTDRHKLITHSNAAATAYTLPQGTGLFGSGWHVWIENRGAGTVTITPTTSTIDGAATLALTTNQGAYVVSDGTNYFTVRGGSGSSTSGTLTRGQAVDMFNLPVML